jgi:histidyl-tRNA synthetase
MLYAPQGKSNTFQVGKVFRRETSSRNQKRLREFYQFDYDMKGYPERFSVFECLDTLIDCLDVIGIGRDMYDVKINDRRIVNKLLENAKVPEELRKTTCSTIDKLDKYRSWELVTKELKEKGVEDPDKVRAEFCKNIQQRTRSKDGYWMEPAYFDTIPNLSYSSTLVRGLDYYTGVVFEVVLKDTRMSIAAGGQYNDSIGFSIGLDRIQDLIPPLSEYQRKTWYLITFGGIEVEIAALKRAREMRQDYYRVKIYPIKKASKIKNAIAKINKDSGLFEVLGPDDI